MAFRSSSTAARGAVPRVRRRAQSTVVTVPATIATTILVAAVIAGLCFLYLWQEAAILDLTARREKARAGLTELEELNRFLQFRIDEAFSLARISRLARNTLGMIEPTVIRYVPVREE